MKKRKKLTQSKKVYAWHTLTGTWKASRGNHGPLKPGVKLTVAGRLQPCHNGLHASPTALNVLQWLIGPVVTFVKCEGDFVGLRSKDGKFVCRERTILWGYEAVEELVEFAEWCAESTGDPVVARLAARAAYAARDAAYAAALAALAARDAAARAASNIAWVQEATAMLESLLWDGAVRRGLVP